MTQAAAGSSPPPPTLATGTLSPTQRPREQCVPGPTQGQRCSAHSSRKCMKNRRIAPRFRSRKRQRLQIIRVIDLQHETQSVNAWKQNGGPAQTARHGNVGARAGSPGGIGRSGRCRQTSAGQNQTSAINNPPAEAGASARAPSIGQRTSAVFGLSTW